MNNPTRTGRPLDLESLAHAKIKVTLGFKCEPTLKMDLAKEAREYSMSLSEYVEVLLARRHSSVTTNADKKEILRLSNELSFYEEELTKVTDDLFFYENDILTEAFSLHKGKTVKYVSVNGEQKEIFIKEIKDVYTVLIETAKLQ